MHVCNKMPLDANKWAIAANIAQSLASNVVSLHMRTHLGSEGFCHAGAKIILIDVRTVLIEAKIISIHAPEPR